MKEKKKKQKERKKENNNNDNTNKCIRQVSENGTSKTYLRLQPASFFILTDCELQMELKDEYNNKLWQNLIEGAVYRNYGEALIILIYVVYLLSILLSVCVTRVLEPKVDPHS